MVKPTNKKERALRRGGLEFIAGVDEAGCGALAGPVVAAAVVLPSKRRLPVRDSKQLSPAVREELYDDIVNIALGWGVGIVSAEEIDRIGIRPATLRAMKKAIENIVYALDHIIVDAWTIPNIETPQTGIIRGDQSESLIAAASIVAKVTRDRLMREAHTMFPVYRFDEHKGYGTAVHRFALRTHGASPIHRLTFSYARS